MWRKVEAKSSS